MAFDLLSEPVRRYIRDKRWEQLRPIQAAAITKIIESNDNFILASRTASGKTEAAFLPILSKVNFNDIGVRVLYISPLIALINDQFYRIEELCKYLDVPVTKWHGEASRSQKEHIIKNPGGIVLITPESLEAMFVNKPYNVNNLFSNLSYVVIDEIHSFIGTDRGTQLKSILSRLQDVNVVPFSIVGLSATIGDYIQAKRFTGNEAKTRVLLDRTPKTINAVFRYFENEGEDVPLELLKDLYLETKDNKVLVFPNSRGKAEEVAVKLKKLSEKVKGHHNYFSHHSSVDKEVREFVEFFAKNNKRQNFLISCTSTLELGIDIGTVDEVVQIDATHSIASLIQRVGRSGRKEGESSNLFLYTTGRWSLLQSLACWELYSEGFIEPPSPVEKPYDILLHQALSIVKGHSGIAFTELGNQLKNNYAFRNINISEINEILYFLIETDLLEQLQHEVIIGIEGEKIVNSRDFYSVFKTEENFKVTNNGNTIGEIPFSPQTREGENILLAAKVWKIKFVDERSRKIEVLPANDGKKPVFFGGAACIHPRIREKMLEILFSNVQYDVLNERCLEELRLMRSDFSAFKIEDKKHDRPLMIHDNELEFYSFTGTRINKSISFLLNLASVKSTVDEKDCRCTIHIECNKQMFFEVWSDILTIIPKIDTHIYETLQALPALLDFSKWGKYLPHKFQIGLLKEKYFDFDGAEKAIMATKFISNT